MQGRIFDAKTAGGASITRQNYSYFRLLCEEKSYSSFALFSDAE